MSTQLFSLEGRRDLAAGGTRSIGGMISEGFAPEGVNKLCTNGCDKARCGAVAGELRPTCVALTHDLATVAGCRELALRYSDPESGLAILVNNAGVDSDAPFDQFSEEGWGSVINANIKSPFFLMQAFHRQLEAAGSPGRPSSSINITSIKGEPPNAIPADSSAT